MNPNSFTDNDSALPILRPINSPDSDTQIDTHYLVLND